MLLLMGILSIQAMNAFLQDTKNFKMRTIIILIITLMVFLLPANAEISCQVTTSCSNTDVLHMSNNTNAHAELPTGTDYSYKICCEDTGSQGVTMGTSCSGTTFLKLSNNTNAHVEKATLSNYANDACLSSDDAAFEFSYQSGSCDGWQTCLATISNDTNAHIGDCTSSYDLHVCCNMTYLNQPPTINDVTANPSTIKGGSTITISAGQVTDPNDDNLTLYCSHDSAPASSNTLCTGGNSNDGSPYDLDCLFNVETDDTTHDIYCRVYDGEFYSSTVTTSYTTDSTPPAAVSVDNIECDTTSPYWDNTNNSGTVIQTDRPDSGMVCRWSTTDETYSNINNANECTVGESVSCDLGELAQAASYTYHISCRDAVGNEQSTSQNTDVSFGVDWSDPTTSISGYGDYYLPGHEITFNEDDNIGTSVTILTYECHPDETCNPTTEVDDGSTVSLNSRGTNYVRWYSEDEAGNEQDVKQQAIEINSLPVADSIDYFTTAEATGKKSGSVYFTCAGTDLNANYDSDYNARIWVKPHDSSTWGNPMTTSYSGDLSFQTEYSITDGYPTSFDVKCQIQDDLGEWGDNYTEESVFTVRNTAPIIDDVFLQEGVAKFDTMRIYCDGSDPDGFLSESELTAKIFLRTDEASEWNRIDNETMEFDGSDHYYDWVVTDDGGTEYDVECHLSDGNPPSPSIHGEYKFNDTDGSYVSIQDDWDGDGVSDSTDNIEGTHLNTSNTVNVLIDGSSLSTTGGTKNVDFQDADDGEVFVSFEHDFDTSELILPFITVKKGSDGKGNVLVKGLKGINKTLRVPKVLNNGKVCVKNAEITEVDEITDSCTGTNETLFTNCNSGQTIGDITCSSDGDYYKISGLTHSGAKEFGNARLETWHNATMFITNYDIGFYANYTNLTSGDAITGADCEIKFENTSWLAMNYNSGLYQLNHSFIDSGNQEYTINCSHASYTDLSIDDSLHILPSGIPEFNGVMVFLVLSLVIAGMMYFRRRSSK